MCVQRELKVAQILAGTGEKRSEEPVLTGVRGPKTCSPDGKNPGAWGARRAIQF